MAAETLNFGPEWLRALSSGGSVASPPPSPAMPKYKLADYRYGREEMLALYVKENKVPEELQDKEFAAVLQEEPLQPLALEPLTEEEQRNFSLSVNSVAVLRLMGKGAGPPLPATSRGRGSTRSRGRGRGDSCFYQRSIEEGDGAFGRNPREIQRSQSWDDRGERRFEKPARRDGVRSGFEEGGAGPRKEHARSDSENWRSLREEQEDDGSWRLGAGPRRDGDRWRSTSPDGGPRSAGWREHGERRRKFDFDLRGERGGCGEEDGRVGGGNSHLRRCRGLDGFEDDKDGLPEWCLEDEDEEMGTFDASGAFLPLKKGPKEAIPEEQELDFRGLEEEEEEEEEPSEGVDEERPEAGGKEATPLPPPENSSSPSSLPALGPLWTTNEEGGEAVEKELPPAEGDELRGLSLSPRISSPPGPPGDLEDEEGLKHLQQEAEKLVASLQDSSLEEEQFTAAMQTQGLRHSTAATALPLSHGAARKWFYKDPQGEIQGPFTTQEMAEWFQAGYFSMSLLVKRGCDEGFQPLGEVIKMWGRVPFAPGPSPPPLLGNMDQERLKKQQELAAAALYQQLQHQHFLQLVGSRQLPQCTTLREKAAMGDLTPPQQQQLTTFLQQLQALKTPRGGDQNLLPTMSRSLSVPDSGPLWDLHTSASSQSGGEASLWDIPINSSTQGPILEQLQLQHKFQERREVELRAKREEEERKRREEKRRQQQQQQEEQKRRQEEEELFRRKQVRQQELLLKLLQQQQATNVPVPPAPSSPPPLWAGLAKQGLSMKTLLELQMESERQLHKQAAPREPLRAQAPNHRVVSTCPREPLCRSFQECLGWGEVSLSSCS